MDDVTDLVKWLRAQLDDDERVARDVGGGPWHADTHIGDEYNIGVVVGSNGERIASCGVESLDDGDVRADHIARHDPARVLAEVDAKRRIMAIHHPRKFEGMGGLPQICDGCGYGGICDDPITEDINDCPILRVLALPYADRPGYREDWRP